MMATPAAALLTWYDQHAADLPWRSSRDPYRVWLSEIMLQQTRIETVIPYYARFLARYPTVADLAAASLDEVLKLWEGLGYYSRARNLHRAAQQVVTQHQGQFPCTVADLLALPGIGRYTAGAIASICCGERVPVLDGNVMRVFARLLDLAEAVTLPAVQKRLWEQAADWLPLERVGDYNQALMELGQTRCTPRKPQCGQCPLQTQCLAFQRGTQAERPVKQKKAAIPHYDVAAGIIYDEQGRILIAQRPTEGLLGGLWEFPGGKQETGETLPACLQRELREELAIEVSVGELFVQVPHAFTHFKITLHAFECRYLGASPPYDAPQTLGAQAFAWVTPTEFARYSFGKADREVIAALIARPKLLL
jgi:A/G-specific adenine glycosylase